MYLIQRGKIQMDKPLSEYTSLFGDRNERLVDFDYMGSAEFEFGAIPKCIQRIFKAIEKGDLEERITSICNPNGVPLILIGYDEVPFTLEKYEKFLKKYLAENFYCSTLDHTIFCKKWVGLEYHQYSPEDDKNTAMDAVWHRKKVDFWLDIDNDVIFFYGAKDRQIKIWDLLIADYKKYYNK